MAPNPSVPTTLAEMKQWLREWIVTATGMSITDIADDRPVEEFGLSSRDVVILSGDLQRLTGARLDATVAYEYNTINALADYLITGASGAAAPVSAASSERADAIGAERPQDVHDIAIIGMAGRYPGAADAEELWALLSEYRSGVGPLPEGRWQEFDSDPVAQAKIDSAKLEGGYLEDIASFDAEFFGISPLEATNMDPQQRLTLETVWRALEDARIPANAVRGTNVGVFMGSSNNDYGMLISGDSEESHPYALTGNSSAVIPNRVNYFYDFRGPSVSVDTACSSSLVAVHQAVRALRDGEASMAIAGGVNILAHPFPSLAFDELGVLSPTGQIHAFSDDADGIVRSEGVGVVVLKTVAAARRDGDRILAVIKGSAVNSDGRSNGLTAPNPDAQADVLRAAYRDAGVNPLAVDYVETHGTGTILGDPIEATALGAVLGAGRDVTRPLLIGSAKTNLGHMEAAAGIAGVMKVVLALREDTIPPSLNYAGPNPYIDFDHEHLEVVEDVREWPRYSGTALAGVSGFGFGGTNAHIVISAYSGADDAADAAPEDTAPPLWSADAENTLVPVSGLLPSRRKQAAADIAEWITSPQASQHGSDLELLTAVARTQAKRNHARSRAAIVAASKEKLSASLERVAQGRSGTGIAVSDAPAPAGPVWVYSGFGSQHRLMGKDLCALSPRFAARLRELDEIVQRESGWSVVELVMDDEQTYGTETAQVSITAIQIALTDFLADLGVRPAAVVGQSMGEIAAAYAVGGLTWQDAMHIACHRSRLMGEGESLLPEEQQGAMAVVEFGVEELNAFIAEHPDFASVEPAVYAAPGMTTVGGPVTPVTQLVEYLENEGRFARKLQVKGAGHTSMLDPILGELAYEIGDITPQAIHTPLYSTVDRGTIYRPGQAPHSAEYFLRCTRQPVWFNDAATALFTDGFRTFFEISANPVALMPLMNTAFAANAAESKLLYFLKRKESAEETILHGLAELYVQGQPVRLEQLVGEGDFVALPGTRLDGQKYWTTARPISRAALSGAAATDMPGTRVPLPDNQIAFSVPAEVVPSAAAQIEAVAELLNTEAGPEGATAVNASGIIVRDVAALPAEGPLTTVARQTVAGWAVSVFDAAGPSAATLPLLAEGFIPFAGQGASAPAASASAPAAASADAAAAPSQALTSSQTAAGVSASADVTTTKWDPASGESASDRLRAIVSESMGYDIEDLPGELPLIDLGLDSLMGMRIKNRVEHDFDLPPLQVQALRDGSVNEVIAIVENLIAERHGAAGESSSPAVSAASVSDAAPAQPESVDYSATAGGVAPRDASERLVFATWAKITGKSAGGVTAELPTLTEAQAAELAERLTERSGGAVSVSEVLEATTIEGLAAVVREHLESDVEGNIRTLRARPEGSTQPSVFLFHPAGGSSVVYAPLMRRLPEDVPVYGVERLEGPLVERAAAYLDEIRELAAGQPILLGGWSFGGALAYEVARQLQTDSSDAAPVVVGRIVLLDTVQPKTPIPQTNEEMHARWDRYAAFAKKTYGLELEIPHELLESQGEDVMMAMFQQFLGSPEASALGLPAGILEHQRASFVDNRILGALSFEDWAEVKAPVTLFRAERMHDGAIELEPAYAEVAPDGGWGAVVEDLEIVQLQGDHLAIVDEPEIATVGRVLSDHIATLAAAAETEEG